MKRQYPSVKDKLYKKEWVVYAKKAFGGPDQVLEYLGRYTHKICISNYRIIGITKTHITLRYTDRKVNKIKCKTILGADFLRLFAEHILPKGFVKIRYFGILSSRTKKIDLGHARNSLGIKPMTPVAPMTTRELIIKTTGRDPYQCPACKKGEMVITNFLMPIRGSPIKIPFRSISKDRKVMLP